MSPSPLTCPRFEPLRGGSASAAEARGFVVYGGRVASVYWLDRDDLRVSTRPEGSTPGWRWGAVMPSAGYSATVLAGDEAACARSCGERARS